MIHVGGVQLLPPMALVARLAFVPLRSLVGLSVQIASTALVLVALAWASLWGRRRKIHSSLGRKEFHRNHL
jgi:hypothetical protein